MALIGFIGLGHMGNPMVKNLLQHGHAVKVYDVASSAVKKMVDEGAQGCSKLSDAVTNCDVVITMLQTGDQVAKVCLAPEGIFNSIEPGKLYIDSSSIDITTCRQIHEAAQKKNIAMLDAPVSGGVIGAQAGTLTFMVGGCEENFIRAKDVLQCMGKRIIYAGEPGNGQAAKICNNMILGVSMIAVSEAFVLGKKLGLNPKKFFEISNNASGQCWALSQYCPMPGVLENVPSNKKFQPGFSASMMLKDLRLSQDASQHANVPTPLGAQATALYTLFVNEGYADLDFSGIIKLIAGNEVDL